MNDNSNPSRRPSGRHLLTFVVVADTHANQEENYSSSPYPCNALANARARWVIAQVNRIDPAFVVHLGDVVNPVPELPTYAAAAENFKALARKLAAPLHVVPGNHDVGDKPVNWMPAGTVNEDHLALYERYFGRHFFSFDHDDLHVVIVNASIINSGLSAEREQRDWLEADLAAAAHRRTFLCIHYPPYVSRPTEAGSYDNIDEPGRSWLLSLVERYRPEAMFCGHVHNFWYDVYADTEMYILPSTAFVRHDYSEFYRGDPGDQHGRNDEAKLGFFVVRVYEHGHVAENIRTYGRTLGPDEHLAGRMPALAAPHSKESAVTTIGVDMRHPWAEEMEIAPSGALDEFERKRARNDYPLMALWEMGLRHMRVPLHDLLNGRVRERMRLLKDVGQSFQVYCYGLPDAEALEALAEHAALADILELVADWGRIDEILPAVRELKARCGLKVYLSRVNRKDGAKHSGGRFNHLISHGFVEDEADELAALQSRCDRLFDGFVMRVPRERDPVAAALAASALSPRLGARVCLYVKTASSSPAETFDDDAENAARTAAATAAVLALPHVELVLDTFADVDRGYFARTGLVDRRFNPRPAAQAVCHLIALMGGGGWSVEEDAPPADGLLVRLRAPGGSVHELRTVEPGDRATATGRSVAEWLDLRTGIAVEDPRDLPAADGGPWPCLTRLE